MQNMNSYCKSRQHIHYTGRKMDNTVQCSVQVLFMYIVKISCIMLEDEKNMKTQTFRLLQTDQKSKQTSNLPSAS